VTIPKIIREIDTEVKNLCQIKPETQITVQVSSPKLSLILHKLAGNKEKRLFSIGTVIKGKSSPSSDNAAVRRPLPRLHLDLGLTSLQGCEPTSAHYQFLSVSSSITATQNRIRQRFCIGNVP
jgi:hypothetical protein